MEIIISVLTTVFQVNLGQLTTCPLPLSVLKKTSGDKWLGF